MPRIGSRLTLDACRAEAMAVARKDGIRGEPEVESYDGWHSSNGPLSNPQGYIFSWNVDEGHAGEVVPPWTTRSRHEPLGSLSVSLFGIRRRPRFGRPGRGDA